MDFTVRKSNKAKDSSVEISNELAQRVIELLSNVDCTCIWSQKDNQYIKVNDIPTDIVHELELAIKLKRL